MYVCCNFHTCTNDLFSDFKNNTVKQASLHCSNSENIVIIIINRFNWTYIQLFDVLDFRLDVLQTKSSWFQFLSLFFTFILGRYTRERFQLNLQPHFWYLAVSNNFGLCFLQVEPFGFDFKAFFHFYSKQRALFEQEMLFF